MSYHNVFGLVLINSYLGIIDSYNVNYIEREKMSCMLPNMMSLFIFIYILKTKVPIIEDAIQITEILIFIASLIVFTVSTFISTKRDRSTCVVLALISLFFMSGVVNYNEMFNILIIYFFVFINIIDNQTSEMLNN